MKLYAGSRSKILAESVSKLLNLPLSPYELIKFGDSELKPVVKEEVRGENCIVIASTSNPVNDSYMEFFLLVDALKRSAANKIIAVMPYFGYARQNQQHLPGEPVSARVIVKFIQSVGVDELVTIDLHEEQLTGFFDIPITHLSALPLLAKTAGEQILIRHPELVSGSMNQSNQQMLKQVQHDGNRIIILSPDQGGVERTRKFRDALDEDITSRHSELVSESKNSGPASPDRSQGGSKSGMTFSVDAEIGIVEKLRNLERQHETKVVEITGDVKNKIVVIPDDVIVSGGTIIHAAQAAKEKGASAVYLAATHADFIEGTVEQLQNSPVEKVFVTDTIVLPDNQLFPKLQVVSVANLLSTEIRKLGN